MSSFNHTSLLTALVFECPHVRTQEIPFGCEVFQPNKIKMTEKKSSKCIPIQSFTGRKEMSGLDCMTILHEYNACVQQERLLQHRYCTLTCDLFPFHKPSQ